MLVLELEDVLDTEVDELVDSEEDESEFEDVSVADVAAVVGVDLLVVVLVVGGGGGGVERVDVGVGVGVDLVEDLVGVDGVEGVDIVGPELRLLQGNQRRYIVKNEPPPPVGPVGPPSPPDPVNDGSWRAFRMR